MYTYYQVANPKSKKEAEWKYVLDSDEALNHLKEIKPALTSILSIKEPIDDEGDKHGKSYKGPFYADIDVDGNPAEAIASARQFAEKLEGYKVNSFAIYLSGKKGFHFVIPMKTLANERPVKSLPLIYKEMAIEMYVEGIDFSVYHEGRPPLLRTVNVKRKDNKKFKVQISREELDSLTPERYATLSEAPRPEIALPEPKLSLPFQSLYEMAKHRMQKKVKAQSNLKFVPDEEVRKTLGKDEKLPQCMNLLLEQGDTKPGANFNQATIQFATYMVRAGVKDWLQHAKTMAKNVKSSSYNTDFKRLLELKKMVNYVRGTPSYGFSKAMLFSVMEPCRDCAVCNGEVEDGEVVPEDYEEYSDIVETPHGYYIGQGKQQRRLTTFTLDMVSKFTEPLIEDADTETRVGAHAVVRVNGHKRERITLLESVWNSTRDFKIAITGRSNYAFYGNDVDLQKLQHKLFADDSDMNEITRVHSMGIHVHKVAGRSVLVYTEPGFSLSSTREKNTHEIWGELPAAPEISSVAYPDPTPETRELIDKMLRCNDPVVTSTIIGWMCLCHIKVQLTMRSNQFPMLNIWGNSGSGKSALGTLLAYLHGVDYMLKYSPMSLQSSTTPWAVAQYCCVSTSTARIIEEFNRSEMSERDYDRVCGIFKSSWNGETAAKGGIDNYKTGGVKLSGAKVMETKIQAPLCIMSEQAPDRPALRQRMVQLNMNKSGREAPGREDDYHYLLDHKYELMRLARALVFTSLNTHPEWVADTMDSFKELVPTAIDTRPNYSYRAVLTGAKFFGKTLKDIGFEDSYIADTEDFMIGHIATHLASTVDDIRVEKSLTEVCLVLREMAIMADSHSRGMPFTLANDENYVCTNEHLYLDTTICHAMYMRWVRSSAEKARVASLQQFQALLQQDDFFVEFCRDPILGGGVRKLAKLDLKKLQARGVETSMFRSYAV